MAIAGSAAQSFEAAMVGGRLVLRNQTLRQGVVTDVATAVAKLLEGRKIFLHAYSPTVEAVRAAVEAQSNTLAGE